MGECRINSPVTWEGSDPHSPAIVTTHKQDNTNNLKFKILKKITKSHAYNIPSNQFGVFGFLSKIRDSKNPPINPDSP